MNVCIISKFPPIQGGIAAKTYWLARGLAESGVTVHVVTNANCVEKEYRIDNPGPGIFKNPTIHYTDSDIPWHIPSSELYVPRLLDKSLEVVRDNHIDVIDTNYLIPYGIVGHLLSRMTGIPYILRHGGSDIAKFLKRGIFSELLTYVIQNATAIITDERNKQFFAERNPNVHVQPPYVPDEKFFKPVITFRDIPTFAYIGKINYHWKHKSLDKIVRIFSGISKPHVLKFVGQGKGLSEFARFSNEHDLKRSEFLDFIHPANMPSFLGEIDYLLHFEKDNPIQDFSNLVCEALWSGVTIITDEALKMHEYTQYTQCISESQIIRLKSEDVVAAQGEIEELIERWHEPVRFNLETAFTFDQYIQDILKIYDL